MPFWCKMWTSGSCISRGIMGVVTKDYQFNVNLHLWRDDMIFVCTISTCKNGITWNDDKVLVKSYFQMFLILQFSQSLLNNKTIFSCLFAFLKCSVWHFYKWALVHQSIQHFGLEQKFQCLLSKFPLTSL